MSKTITISDEAYKMLRDLADDNDRTLSGQISYILKRYKETDSVAEEVVNSNYSLDSMNVNTKVDYLANKFENNNRRKQEHPRLQAIKEELKELSDQLDSENDPTEVTYIMEKIQELQKERNNIIKEIEE